MDVVSVAAPVAATLIVATMGYLQWRRTEIRQARSEAESRRIAETERTRDARVLYRRERVEALRELHDMLKGLELKSRWHGGGQDVTSEVPSVNSFLIRRGAVLLEEDRQLAHEFLDALTWIDRHVAETRRDWERERQGTLESHGYDIGPFESSWVTTGPIPDALEVLEVAQTWKAASLALDDKLRAALLDAE